jgi:hypothetical protein
MYYLVYIPKIDDGSTFHIVKKNLKVDIAPPEVFESKHTTSYKRQATATAAFLMGIQDLQRQGIEVNDDEGLLQ